MNLGDEIAHAWNALPHDAQIGLGVAGVLATLFVFALVVLSVLADIGWERHYREEGRRAAEQAAAERARRAEGARLKRRVLSGRYE